MPAIAAADVDLAAFDLIVDVRPGASSRPAFPSAVPVGLDDLLGDPGSHIDDATSRILIVCDVGVRSGLAADRLTAQGYQTVWSLAGGVEAWRSAGLPLDGGGLDAVQLDRYDRQIKLADIGLDGQRRLLDATATVVGVGGLGLPVIAYLAAAGVGHLRVIDADRVDRSNLQRQPLFRTADIGRPKVEAITAWVRGLDPELDVQPEGEELTAANARSLLVGSDVVVDATDRFPARYAVSDAAMDAGIPVVSGAVYRWEGQVTVLTPPGPCYRCLFPEPPDGVALDCDITGVAGPVVGAVGSMQAVEALKVLTGSGATLSGRLLVYDGLTGTSLTVRYDRRADCIGCSGTTEPPRDVSP